jgi:hypothetical protein
MVSPAAAALVSLAAVLTGCMHMPGSGPPEPDDCSSATQDGPVDLIELGGPDEDAFVPWTDGSITTVTYGPQGGAMIGVRLRARGAGAPPCLAQTTMVASAAGDSLASASHPVNTYEESGASRVTRTIWLILDDEVPGPGESIVVTTSAGRVTASKTLWIDRHPL